MFRIYIGSKAEAVGLESQQLTVLPSQPEMLPEWNISKGAAEMQDVSTGLLGLLGFFKDLLSLAKLR